MNINIKSLIISISTTSFLLVIPTGFIFAQGFERDLYFGLQDDADVTKLQEFLTDQDVYSGPITGNLFSLTLRAVKKFQVREGITPAAGYFGPKTRTRANKILSVAIGESQKQAVLETGTSAPPVPSDTKKDAMGLFLEQIKALQQQIALLQQKVSTPTTTPSGTIPAIPATPAIPSPSTGTPAVSAIPATPAQPANPTPPIVPPPPSPPPPVVPPPAPAPIQIVKDDFNSYADGSIVGQGSWSSYVNGGNFIVQGTTVFEGTKALYVNALADSVATKAGTSLSDGRQAVYVKTQNRAGWGPYVDGNAQFRVTKRPWASGAPGLAFAAATFRSDGNVTYYDPISQSYKNFATYNDNEWTLLEIEWRSSDKTARYRVNSGTWTDWYTFYGSNSFTDFDNVGFDFYLPSGSGGVYFDTLN